MYYGAKELRQANQDRVNALVAQTGVTGDSAAVASQAYESARQTIASEYARFQEGTQDVAASFPGTSATGPLVGMGQTGRTVGIADDLLAGAAQGTVRTPYHKSQVPSSVGPVQSEPVKRASRSIDAAVGRVFKASGTVPEGFSDTFGVPSAISTANAAQYQLLKNRLIAEEIAGGHAFGKHVLTQGEFPGWIRTRSQFQQHIEGVLNNPTAAKQLSGGRTAFWHEPTGTVVIRNPRAVDGGTAFQPRNGVEYFNGLK